MDFKSTKKSVFKTSEKYDKLFHLQNKQIIETINKLEQNQNEKSEKEEKLKEQLNVNSKNLCVISTDFMILSDKIKCEPDIYLKSYDNNIYPAHKLILCQYSDVLFKAINNKNFKKNEKLINNKCFYDIDCNFLTLQFIVNSFYSYFLFNKNIVTLNNFKNLNDIHIFDFLFEIYKIVDMLNIKMPRLNNLIGQLLSSCLKRFKNILINYEDEFHYNGELIKNILDKLELISNIKNNYITSFIEHIFNFIYIKKVLHKKFDKIENYICAFLSNYDSIIHHYICNTHYCEE